MYKNYRENFYVYHFWDWKSQHIDLICWCMSLSLSSDQSVYKSCSPLGTIVQWDNQYQFIIQMKF